MVFSAVRCDDVKVFTLCQVVKLVQMAKIKLTILHWINLYMEEVVLIHLWVVSALALGKAGKNSPWLE